MADVEQVAELLGAGVARALNGRAVLPDDLPWVTGSIGLLGTRPSYVLRSAPIVGVSVTIVVTAAGGFSGSASVWLSGALAGMLVTVGFLYPLPRFRGARR